MPFLLPLAAVGLVGLLTLVDAYWVESAAEMSSVHLGLPFNLLAQDQSLLDPPASAFPMSRELMSPWEAPVDISWLMLAVNVLVVWLVLVGAYQALHRPRLTGRQPGPATTAAPSA